jgi:hypothetical protein
MTSSKQTKIEYWKSLLEALFYANKCYTYTFPFLNTDVIPFDGNLVEPFDEKVRLLYESYKKLQENLKKQIRIGIVRDNEYKGYKGGSIIEVQPGEKAQVIFIYEPEQIPKAAPTNWEIAQRNGWDLDKLKTDFKDRWSEINQNLLPYMKEIRQLEDELLQAASKMCNEINEEAKETRVERILPDDLQGILDVNPKIRDYQIKIEELSIN